MLVQDPLSEDKVVTSQHGSTAALVNMYVKRNRNTTSFYDVWFTQSIMFSVFFFVIIQKKHEPRAIKKRTFT